MTNNEIRWLGDSWRHSTVFAIFVLDSDIELRFLQQLIVDKVLPQCPRLTEKPVVLTNLFGNSHCWMSDRDTFDINRHVFRSRDYPLDKRELQVRFAVANRVCLYGSSVLRGWLWRVRKANFVRKTRYVIRKTITAETKPKLFDRFASFITFVRLVRGEPIA